MYKIDDLMVPYGQEENISVIEDEEEDESPGKSPGKKKLLQEVDESG